MRVGGRYSVAVTGPAAFPETVELTRLDPRQLDARDLAGVAALLEAARVVDCPHEHGETVSSIAARLRHGYDGDPPEMAVARGKGGRVVGVLEIFLPHRDNRHLGGVEVTVDPLSRRQGLGRKLFDAGVDRAYADGRRVIIANSFEGSAGGAFLVSRGFDRVSEEVERRQDILDLDWSLLDREYAAAERHSADYELLRMPALTPDGMLAEVARMTAAINDAPVEGMDFEDEVFTPDRIRALEDAQRAHDRRLLRLIARHRRTGELVGQTVVAVDSEQPWFGWQLDTSVVRAHRGHRLGLTLKIAMLRWLGEDEPQLRTIDTWNAASNGHMIGVNEALGYRVVASIIGWQRRR